MKIGKTKQSVSNYIDKYILWFATVTHIEAINYGDFKILIRF